MKIKTKYQGDIEITQDQIISFPQGILGFEEHKDFIIVSIEGNSYFKFLQNIHHEYISFLVINPWDFYEDYDIELSDKKLKKVNIYPKNNNEIEIYNIVTMGKSLQSSTANLLAPIVINTRDRLGKQFILENSPYSTRHRLVLAGEKSC